MVLCPQCNAEVKYIATHGEILIINIQEKKLINERGRTVTGYELHVCPDKPEEEHAHEKH